MPTGSAAAHRPSAATIDGSPAPDLGPYVPQFVVDWLDAGGGEPVPQYREVTGSLVFADVSGFTPLSERLARKGRVGSEELTEILNRVFGQLLDVASGHGGDLLKYGGDALLLLFTGEEHPMRAAVAAASMQRALRRHSRIDTGSGVVRLRMSVGVHSGTLGCALVGETHRELLLVGPAVTTTVAMESAADAGEVLVSADTAERLDGGWLGDEKAGGRLLRQQRAAGALAPRPFTLDRSARAALAVPEALRDHLARGIGDGEHRHATLAFVQIKGTDALLHDEGQEMVAAELHSIVVACQQAAQRHGVTFLATDIDADGGKILFATGAPRVGAHDSDRMLLAMMAVAEQPSKLAIRVGVNRGHAFAVDVGAPYRRTYAVMGDATNLAARVMGKSATGGILATESVVEDLRADFELSRREPFAVKGKSHPITAFDVGRALAASRASGDRDAPLVGREVERRAIDTAIASAEDGAGAVVVLVAGPGLGKTRLVAHLRDRVAPETILAIEGAQFAAHTPYFALRTPLRALIGAGLADPPEEVADRLVALAAEAAPGTVCWLPLLNEMFGVALPSTPEVDSLDPRFRRSRAASALIELLGGALPSPAHLIVEDAHWLDDSSADVIRSLLRATQDRAWVVIVTSREDEVTELVGSLPAAIHRPGALDHDDSLRLLYELLGDDPLPPLVVREIADRAAGNPLFLAELVAAARRGDHIETLPNSLEGLLAARVDGLDPDDRDLLLSASVLGNRFSLFVLSEMLGEGTPLSMDAFDDLDGLVVRGEHGTARFRSTLVRQVAYESLPYRRRRLLHARAADVLEQIADRGGERPVALLSLHSFAAERYQSAWSYAREAGDLAAAGHAAVEAVALYRRALDAVRHVRTVGEADVARVWLALGEQSEFAGDTATAESAFARARALLRSDGVGLAEVMSKDGWLRERSRHYADALRWYRRGLTTLERHAPRSSDARGARLHADLTLSYGAVRLRQGRYRDGLRWLLDAAAEASANHADDVLAHAYYLLDWALTDLGRADEAADYRGLALPIYERLGDYSGQANVLNNLGIDAYYEGRWDEALELYERSRAARERCGDVVQLGLVSNNIGEILSDQGRLAEAEALFREALQIWRGSGFRIGDGVATSNMGRAAARNGRLDEAGELYVRASKVFDEIGAASFRADVDVREAERRLLGSAFGHALLLADDVAVRPERVGSATPAVLSMSHRVAGCALAGLGRHGEALTRIERALAIARDASAEYETAAALEALAQVMDAVGDEAAESYGIAAAVIFDRLGVEAPPATRHGNLAGALAASASTTAS